MTDLYSVLGVTRDATHDEIKAVYRRLASIHHPDKEGGDNARFQEISAAWEVLGDPVQRARYDSTGSTNKGPPVNEMAQMLLAEVLLNNIDQLNETVDPVVFMKQWIHNAIGRGHQANGEMRSQIAKRERTIAKLKAKTKSDDDVLSLLLKHDIAGKQRNIEGNTERIKLHEIALDLLNEYNFDTLNQPLTTV